MQILILCESEKELFSEIFVSLLPILVSFCKNGVKLAENREKLLKNGINLYKTTDKVEERERSESHTNFHLYHYAGNNPVKYTDPDGREINLDGDAEVQKKILKLINNLSSSQYRIENNRLVKDEKNINIYGSQKYSEVIDNLIENGSTYIQIADTYKDEYGKQKPLPLALDGIQQAGYTYGSNDQKIMNVSINGKSAKIIPTANGYADTATPEEILMHELVGHAEPRIMNVVGNAIDKENIIRGELMSKNPSHRFLFRMSDKKHSTHP